MVHLHGLSLTARARRRLAWIGRQGPLRVPLRAHLRVLAWGAAAMALALLTWLGVSSLGARDDLRMASQRAVRVAELRGTIAYLDEWLTMSAEMAAASGERRWVERYDEAAPRLDAALAEASELASPEVREELAGTTGEAHRDLVAMERRALDLTKNGDTTSARALLNGPEFGYLKDVYASGIEAFGQDLTSLAAERAAALNDRAWLEAAGVGTGVVLLISIVLILRGQARLGTALARTEAVARTDMLTGLPNRRQFYEQLDAVLAEAVHAHALLLIDLDRFKAANDGYGHPAGDEVLRLVSARLRDALKAGDLIARFGGDEFAIVIACGRDDPAMSEPARVAGRIVGALQEPFALAGGAKIQIGGSVGLACTQPGDTDVVALMHRADVALYRAKSEGRSCFRFFEPAMDAHVRDRALLQGDLRQAIVDKAIVPHFQPLVDLRTGRCIGVEMLARWEHPTRGMDPPVEFIPLAEDLGLIGPMTELLIRQACRAAAAWPGDVALACNVSPTQLRDLGLPVMIRSILEETGFAAGRLELEVTENALVGDLVLARTLLEQLKALGVGLALDDFGTGYSGLRHLQSLPFDKLKIDAGFVGAMADDQESRKIVSSVIQLGHSLGLSIVAEGVETEDVAILLRGLGCDIGQGWLYGRPAAADVTARRVAGEPDPPGLPEAIPVRRRARRPLAGATGGGAA